MTEPKQDRVVLEACVLEGVHKVDDEKYIIYDALLLGQKSLNKRAYPANVRELAAPKFQGAEVHWDHSFDKSGKGLLRGNDMNRKMGKVLEAHHCPEGIRGNVKLLKSHPQSKTILECASDPTLDKMYAFSAAMDCKWGDVDGEGNEVCLEIKEVGGVDVVDKGGTTRGVFERLNLEKVDEGESQEGEEKREASADEHYCEACRKKVLEHVDSFLQGEKTAAEATDAIARHLKAHAKMHGDGAADEKKQAEEEAAQEALNTELKQLKHEKMIRATLEDYLISPDKEILASLAILKDKKEVELKVKEIKREQGQRKKDQQIKTSNGFTKTATQVLRGY